MDIIEQYEKKKKALDKVMRVLKAMDPELRERIIEELLAIIANRVDQPGE
jgi:hypothetical protein